MSEHVIELNDSNFNEQISKGVTLVDFWAPWCGPCRIQVPIIEKVAEKTKGKAVVAKVNVDDAKVVASKFGVQSIPTLIVFKDGRAVQQFVGVQNEADLFAAIDKA